MATDATAGEPIRRTPLYEVHRRLGGRLVPFAGWELPVQYAGTLAEHRATRMSAGLFDVSHMGEVTFEGPSALAQLQNLTTNDLTACADGQAQYSSILRPDGGMIDDIVVYRISAESLLVCVNAANRDKDVAWLVEHGTAPGCAVTDRGDDYAQIALQGPKAAAIAQKLTSTELSTIRTYWHVRGSFAGVDAIIARTGYTGEDGFEFFVAPQHAEQVWNAIVEAGGADVVPCGLGARDSLRLESAYRLYGNDMDETINPLEAGLGWIVKLNKGDFIGRQALVDQKERGLSRRLVGLRLIDKGIARHGYTVVDAHGVAVGAVTSGTMSPTLNQAIAMAYVPPQLAAEGTVLGVDLRGRVAAAVVVKTPFYRRGEVR